jgi:hypothetical protein
MKTWTSEIKKHPLDKHNNCKEAQSFAPISIVSNFIHIVINKISKAHLLTPGL